MLILGPKKQGLLPCYITPRKLQFYINHFKRLSLSPTKSKHRKCPPGLATVANMEICFQLIKQFPLHHTYRSVYIREAAGCCQFSM